jgi:hypothetical protein
MHDVRVYNLRKITAAPAAVDTAFEHMSLLVHEIRDSVDATLEALFAQDLVRLRVQKEKVRKIQVWTNIIIANVFKAMRLLQKEDPDVSCRFAQTVRRLQEMTDGYRDTVMRALNHIAEHHKGLLAVQVEELRGVKELIHAILVEVEFAYARKDVVHLETITRKDRELRGLADELNRRQMERIVNERSKTRLSILYYAIVGNAMQLSKQHQELLEIFLHAFGRIGAPGR